MHKLERISLHNWSMIDAEDIEIDGATCFIGPTGAGKSSIVDAIQTVITGNNQRRLKLNAAVEGRDRRNVRDYCLGMIDDLPRNLAHKDNPDGLRAHCESTLVLTFRDTETAVPTAVGLMLRANIDDRDARETARFIADGLSFRLSDYITEGEDGRQRVLAHSETLDRMGRGRNVYLTTHNTSAIRFVEEYLRTMRRRGAQPDPDQFLTAFRNMVAFEPVDDATKFVRRYVLPYERLDVEHIRNTIEHWRGLNQLVDNLEAEIGELHQLQKRYNAWGEATVEQNTQAFLAAHAERRRLDEDLAAKDAAYRETEEKLRAEEQAQSNHEAAIQRAQDELDQQRTYQSNSPEAAKRKSAEDRIDRARRDIGDVQGRIARRAQDVGRIANLEQLKDYLAQRYVPAIEAARAVAKAATGSDGPDGTEVDRLERQALDVLNAYDPLDRQREATERDLAEAKREQETLQAQIDSAGGQAFLTPEVAEFRRTLEDHGITVTPLPDICEITDETWAQAAEQILGPHREALIVEDGRTREAFDILYRNRGRFHTCRLVAAERLRRNPPRVRDGAVAEVVTTDHDIARAFIDQHLGNVIRVTHEAELERHERAIMPNGKMQGGAALRVYKDLQPILGKTAQENALRAARERVDTLSGRIYTLRRTQKLLKSGINTLTRLADDPENPGAGAAPQLADLLRELDTAEGELSSAQTAYDNVDDPELRRIGEEIKRLQKEIKAYQAELEETVKPNIKGYYKTLNQLSSERGRFEEQRSKRLEQEQTAEAKESELAKLIHQLEAPETIAQARQLLETRLFHHPGQERATLATVRDEADRQADDARTRIKQRRDRADRDFRKYYETYRGNNPLETDYDDPVERLVWIIREAHKLERDELNPYREQVREARAEIERALREDLLTKLADKFQKVESQKNVLNRRLRKRTFNGMTYWFSHATDPNLSKLYHIAKRIAEQPDRGASIVDNTEHDPEIAEAMEQVEAILSRDEDTSYLEDYRNYFTFELWMQPEHGGDPIPWSKRSQTASGGQRQAPFYVAIAASMAAAYYPHSRQDRPEGMGLVLFDEAFNRLDVPTTQKLMSFFESLSLQVLAAAPEAQRPTFLEVADTLVSVNKRPNTAQMRIQSKGVQQHARDSIARANPQHLGVEGFRQPQDGATQASTDDARVDEAGEPAGTADRAAPQDTAAE
ncbi:SbcC/MukB-like Walker B domain-containing protein [Rhodovibrio salinarum]|uniref:Uncharacterized protein n=1 Tax=Rhodovibrio salinarum TaxID=1087 RepID=A0A934QK17_9PROT|nr:SbcC/MukB-like Walker B domain-containing protein [Rhodovibrio salinarum]MBK1698296.1 hypothetical protein [Rhodovibrio salinarum]